MSVQADIIVIGGGPAGLSGALILGRSLRKVIVFEDGRHRNRFSHALHGFLTRDDIPPTELLRLGKKECEKYGVIFVHERVRTLRNKTGGFSVTTESGATYDSKKVLLATGLTDDLPPFRNAEAFFGTSLFHCPFCDGYEFRDLPWAVYAHKRAAAVDNCMKYLGWTSDVTLLAQDITLDPKSKSRLERNGVKIVREKVSNLEGRDGILNSIEFENGSRIPARVLFFSAGTRQRADFGTELECRCTPGGVLILDRLQQSSVAGLYVAGDMARDMQLAVIAAAEGAKAGVAIQLALTLEERG
jgi:thioredoxin reductase